MGGTGYSYDNNGNLTDDGTYLYYYDCENRLTDVNDKSTGNPVASYSYDYQGRRTSKTVSGVTTKYCYDGAQVIAEYDGSNTLLRKFIYGPGIDKPICMIDIADSNTVYYYHFDGLGSVIALSDVNSVIVERYSYDVFGQPSNTSDVNNPYLFTGRRYDDETGLYYYRARYYDYATGRFMQTDPVGYTAGLNLYAYCGNNPGNFVDPLGLFLLDSDVYYSGLSVLGNIFISGQVQATVVADTSGNIGILITGSYGGGVIGGGVANVFGAVKATENLNRPLTNFDLAQGDSKLTGISYGIGEEEVTGEKFEGSEFTFGPVTPDMHHHTSVNTAYLHIVNYNTDIYDPLHSFGYDLGSLEQAVKKKITDSLISGAKNIGNTLQQLAGGLKNKLSDLGKKMLQPFKDMFGPKKE